MSSDAGDEIPRETSVAAESHGSGTALKASLAVLGLLFCFGVGLVGETYFREWRGKDAKPAQVTAQLPQSETPRNPEITAKPASAQRAETEIHVVAAENSASTLPSPHPAAASDDGASAPSTAPGAAAASHEMSSAGPSAAATSALAAIAPAAPPAAPVAAVPAAVKTATAKPKPATAARQAASKPSAAATSRLHYRVQFGAFAVEENAEILRRAIETPKLRISITRAADRSGRLLYHVRTPAFASYSEALTAVREAQDAAKRAQFGEAVEYLIQQVDESGTSPREQARIQAAQSANP